MNEDLKKADQRGDMRLAKYDSVSRRIEFDDDARNRIQQIAIETIFLISISNKIGSGIDTASTHLQRSSSDQSSRLLA